MFRMFTGDPGPQGLPGLYTMQIPHRVQKRDTGNLSQMFPNHIKSVTYM